MKKAIIAVFAFALVCFGLWGFSHYYKKIVYVPALASYYNMPNDIIDLETASDTVILARVLPNSVNVVEKLPDGTYAPGYTRTELEVLQVFAGDVTIGDLLTITESYCIIETLSEKQIHHRSNYGPSIVGQEYIFFLKKHTDDGSEFFGMYTPFGIDRGRYPVFKELLSSDPSNYRSVNDYTNRELNLGDENSAVYREIFKDVVDQYFSQIARIKS